MQNKTRKLLEKHFDTAFAAPDGIKRLREMILTLAMQGKLVPQDPEDQPASELLKEIEAVKQRLIKAGNIKKPKPLPEIKPDEIPYKLPQGWEWVRLGNIAIFENGDRSRRYPTEIDLQPSGVPFFGAKDMLDGKLRFDNGLRFISEAKFSELSKGKLIDRDFVILLRGTVGKTAIFTANEKFSTGFINAQMIIVRMLNKKMCDFFNAYSASKFFGSLIELKTTGSAVRQMPAKVLLDFLIPLPPLDEQHRIAAKIDQLMARCDALEKLRAEHVQKRLAVHTAALAQMLEAQERHTFAGAWQFITRHFGELYTVKENVAQLRKAILQLAVMGKLVPQDTKDQPASALLKEIEAEKQRLIKEGKIKRPKPLPEIKQEELLYELPESWEWVRLGNIGVINPRNLFDDEKDAGFIPMPLIYAEYGAPHKFETKKWGEIKKGYTHFADDDVAIAKITPCFENGKSCVFSGLPNEIGAGTTELHVFRNAFNAIYSKYLLAYLKNPKYISSGISKMTGSAGQKRVPTTFFSQNPFPLPPLAEQYRIAAKIDQLMARCDALEKQNDAATGKQTALLDAVMAQV